MPGALGAVMGLMMWMWLSTIVVLIGAELNSEIEHQTLALRPARVGLQLNEHLDYPGDVVSARLQARARRHRVEAARFALARERKIATGGRGSGLLRGG